MAAAAAAAPYVRSSPAAEERRPKFLDCET
jgi:hypothetical protein